MYKLSYSVILKRLQRGPQVRSRPGLFDNVPNALPNAANANAPGNPTPFRCMSALVILLESDVSVCLLSCRKLAHRVDCIEATLKMLQDLPLNKELFDCTCEKDCTNHTPISTMWKVMQLRKDTDNNTQAIGKVRATLRLNRRLVSSVGDLKRLRSEV